MATSKKFLHAIIMGAPASGKGTISERILKRFQLHHISCGDILRQHIQQQTPLGIEANRYIRTGALVPNDLVNKIIVTQIDALSAAGTDWLLDGFPRTIPQADYLAQHHRVGTVLNLAVPNEVIVERVQGRWVHLASGRVYNVGFNRPKVDGRDDVTGEPLVQREDDRPETVRKRLEVYDTSTKPLVDYYDRLGVLATFEGRTSNEIWPKVERYLDEKLATMS